MDSAIDEVKRLAELIGPNPYLQALVIAVVFILIGKIADWILSRAVGKVASRSKTDVDDRLVALLHQPIFMSFVLVGLGLATQRLQLAGPPTFITLGILKTFAVAIWYNMLRQLTDVLVQTARRNSSSKLVQTGMLALIQNVAKVVLFALAIYFIFLAWDINVTAWGRLGRYRRSRAQFCSPGYTFESFCRRIDCHGCAVQEWRLHHPRHG